MVSFALSLIVFVVETFFFLSSTDLLGLLSLLNGGDLDSAIFRSCHFSQVNRPSELAMLKLKKAIQ